MSVKQATVVAQLPEPVGDTQGLVGSQGLLVLGGAVATGFSDVVSVITAQGEVRRAGTLPYRSRGHQAVWLRDQPILLGGFDGGTRDDVHVLDLAGGHHRRLAPMPVAMAWFAAEVVDDRIVVVGGFNIPGGYQQDVFVYDPARDAWTREAGAIGRSPLATGRLGSQALIADGATLLSCGGADRWDGSRQRANAIDRVLALDTRTWSWREAPPLGVGREGLVAVTHGRTALLIGGQAEEEDEASRVVEAMDLDSGQIRVVAELSEPRLTPAAGIVGGRLFVAGGVRRLPDQLSATVDALDLPL